MTIGIVGCGNLDLSLLNGIKKQDKNIQVIASKRDISELSKLNLSNTYFTTSNAELIQK